jgi:hypothetical protein
MNNFDNEINELEAFFATAKIPAGPITFDQCSIIVNPATFIDSHLATLKNNNGNVHFLSYLERLQKFSQLIKK